QLLELGVLEQHVLADAGVEQRDRLLGQREPGLHLGLLVGQLGILGGQVGVGPPLHRQHRPQPAQRRQRQHRRRSDHQPPPLAPFRRPRLGRRLLPFEPHPLQLRPPPPLIGRPAAPGPAPPTPPPACATPPPPAGQPAGSNASRSYPNAPSPGSAPEPSGRAKHSPSLPRPACTRTDSNVSPT